MYGDKTENVFFKFLKKSFETYKTFLRRIITECERKADVKNHQFG